MGKGIMKLGTGGLGSDPEAVDEVIAPGMAHHGPLSAPHDPGTFDEMHRGRGSTLPVYTEYADEDTAEHSPETCLRHDPAHPERGLRLTTADRIQIARGVRMLGCWMRMVGAPLERSDIERRLIEDALAHLRAHPTATFSSCIVNAVKLLRPQST